MKSSMKWITELNEKMQSTIIPAYIEGLLEKEHSDLRAIELEMEGF